MSVDINALKPGDRVLAEWRAHDPCEVLFVGQECVFVRYNDDGEERAVEFSNIIRKLHPKVMPDELAGYERWAVVTHATAESNLSLSQFIQIQTSQPLALMQSGALGAVRLVPETNDDGSLAIHWRDEAKP